ncbi:tetratricopeptide repeat protein [Engelhardtia mirabilis]|uniref:Tetratricopeptide repeat protein n=1 Tax=Engelhardtia mirabilis TaxID=2528011 RepID=A0A518BE08_9BACT|nr:Tetratricopeptide repeat protein [Planctomycetes bacterium Pla133]QDU99439.1 Tetratricopeptide repeat protein [Planctomycetes bacterium Pla86]
MLLSALTLCALIGDGAPLFATAPTPAERSIEAATAVVERHPADARAHADLALAWARRARETGDPRFYETAMESVAAARAADADSFAAGRAEAWIALGQHDFPRALELATELNARVPDDLLVYGLLVDARVELGQYESAIHAAQWMLDLRPGNIPGLTRAAYLRELTGDIDGAVDLMLDSYRRANPRDVEDRAWILCHLAHLEAQRGEHERAEGLATQALELFPGYHYALAQRGAARRALGDLDGALDDFALHFAVADHPENLVPLAECLELDGRADEAGLLLARFERAAVAECDQLDNANGALIAFWVDRVGTPEAIARALELSGRELERRGGLASRSDRAWALAAAGEQVEAVREIDRALEIGSRDPLHLFRAGSIRARAGQAERARQALEASLAADPRSSVAAAARALLESLPQAATAGLPGSLDG